MKKFGKLLILILCTAIGLSGFACNRDDPTVVPEDIDYSKSQLYVGTFDGGFRDNWLNAHAREFEELHAETSFEPGKKGVQVYPYASRDYGTDGIFSVIDGAREEVLFLEQSDYYRLVREDKVLEITDIVNEKLTDYGEDQSIFDKMNAVDRDFYNVEGKYYGIPFFEAMYGIFYDVDLFEEKNLFYAAPGEGNPNGFVTSPSTPRSDGPDGKPDTYDDGLPATFDEFFKLCDRMVQLGITPIGWSGKEQGYVNAMLASLACDAQGYDETLLNFTFDGTAEKLVSGFDANGKPQLYSEEISESNGYLLRKQVGRYYALEFAERLFTNERYYDPAVSMQNNVTIYGAQENFLKGRFDDAYTLTAMHIDGTWWFNEAVAVLDNMANIPGAGRTERNIALMPFPKPDDTMLGEFTYLNTYMTEVVIKKTIDPAKIDLAKEFIKFCHTNGALSEFTALTGTTRPYTYTIEEEDEDVITPYGRNLFDIHQSAKTLSPYSSNDLFLRFPAASSITWETLVNNTPYTVVTTTMANEGITARNYFNGMARYMDETRWNSNYGPF